VQKPLPVLGSKALESNVGRKHGCTIDEDRPLATPEPRATNRACPP
jgi:hypothetical protein